MNLAVNVFLYLLKINICLMRIIFFLFFICVSYYALYIMPKKSGEGLKFWAPIVVTLVLMSALPGMLTAMNIKLELGYHPVIGSILSSIQLLLVLIIFNRLSTKGIDDQINYHRANNLSNVNRFPIRQVINHQHKLKSFATWFWFAGSILLLYGVWFGSQINA
jgi:hypothetical protein